MTTIYQAIMCGGEGKRLWPLSRRSLPKYYIPLADGESLFQKAFQRCLLTSNIEDILLVTTVVNRHSALKQARAIIPDFPSENLVLRPEGKETFATLACALGIMIDRGAKRDDVLICSPADHVINDTLSYKQTLLKAAASAARSLVTIGIKPTEPSSDFGYIAHKPTAVANDVYEVQAFTEKPSTEQAKGFLLESNYLWNAGIYLGSLQVYLDEIRKNDAMTADLIERGAEAISNDFALLPEKSIDYEISIKAKHMLVVPATFDWDDYGDFDSFIKAQGLRQNQAIFGGQNVTASTSSKLFVSVGVSDITVVQTRDALLVVHKSHTSNLSQVVNSLKESNYDAVDHHYTGYRPWGTFEVIDDASNYVVKKITIDPGCMSSIQTHTRRSEHWVIVSGTAKVALNDRTSLLHTGESLYVPPQARHRIENPTAEPLVLIEVQTGSQLDEDDIKREEDPYGSEHPTYFK